MVRSALTSPKWLQWSKDHTRWLVWLVLIGIFIFLDSEKIAFRYMPIWIAIFTAICFLFVITFYLLRDSE